MPSGHFLLDSTSTNLKEFDYAQYFCQDGATLDGVNNAGIDDGSADGTGVKKFLVECPADGVWPDATSVVWPTCDVKNCTSIPAVQGFEPTISAPVAVGDVVPLECANTGFILDDGSGTGWSIYWF